MPRQLWAMLDDPSATHRRMQRVASYSAARALNEQGFGVFWTVNSFRGERRVADELERVCAWAVDLDGGDKAAQWERISGSPLLPSVVVETKNGHHVYWEARDADASTWNAIVLERLVPWFDADPNARDLCRILRVPSFKHWKDPANPFECRTVHAKLVTYTPDDMLRAFAPREDQGAAKRAHAESKRDASRDGVVTGDSFWDRVYSLDCGYALAKLSGSPCVRGEHFEFRATREGKRNVLVGGKGTSVWLDRHGRIGSLSKGGPTIAQWLRWYGLSWREVVDVIKANFPEVGQ
jgi:hypothetical protein